LTFSSAGWVCSITTSVDEKNNVSHQRILTNACYPRRYFTIPVDEERGVNIVIELI
jgi:hypothetical protein